MMLLKQLDPRSVSETNNDEYEPCTLDRARASQPTLVSTSMSSLQKLNSSEGD